MRSSTSQHTPPSFRRAFTTIEILTAVGIIAVLASIAIVGMSRMIGQTKSNSTKVDVQNLMSMTTELSAAGALKRPATWRWGTGVVSYTPPNPTNVDTLDLNFWKVPYRDGSTAVDVPLPLPSPGNVDEANVATWKTNAAIVNTAVAFSRLMTAPANKAAFEKYAADRRKVIPNDATTANIDESLFPLLVDQWGRPMIFVPASGRSPRPTTAFSGPAPAKTAISPRAMTTCTRLINENRYEVASCELPVASSVSSGR